MSASLWASFYRKRLESAHLAIFVDVSDQFILRGAFGFLFCRGAAGLSGNRARHAGTREHFDFIDLFGFLMSNGGFWLSPLHGDRH